MGKRKFRFRPYSTTPPSTPNVSNSPKPFFYRAFLPVCLVLSPIDTLLNNHDESNSGLFHSWLHGLPEIYMESTLENNKVT